MKVRCTLFILALLAGCQTFPPRRCTCDQDSDGFISLPCSDSACGVHVDCNDSATLINPNSVERCDGVDDDCDGRVDESTTLTPVYLDRDGDGYGDASTVQLACLVPLGSSAQPGDCNDASASAHPYATEMCNMRDDDCDAFVDESVQFAPVFLDADGDSYGTSALVDTRCDGVAPTGSAFASGDCNDSNWNVHPFATEVCNLVDEDCDGLSDEGSTATVYPDQDHDGHGTPSGPTPICGSPAFGQSVLADDCDDSSATIHPGVAETCDGVDQDCDGQVDDGLFEYVLYADTDGDGYGSGPGIRGCANSEPGHSSSAGDCNDAARMIHPNASEILCDSIDQNCTGADSCTCSCSGHGTCALGGACSCDLGFAQPACDSCSPGYQSYPSCLPIVESCNGIDDDADGIVDDVANCWVPLYRFSAVGGADFATTEWCWSTSSTAPVACGSMNTFDRISFYVHATPLPNGMAVVQCIRAHDSILVESGSTDFGALLSAGYVCGDVLGYVYRTMPAVTTPFASICSIKRFSAIAQDGTGTHLFETNDYVAGLNCEPPDRGYAPTNGGCFSSDPCAAAAAGSCGLTSAPRDQIAQISEQTSTCYHMCTRENVGPSCRGADTNPYATDQNLLGVWFNVVSVATSAVRTFSQVRIRNVRVYGVRANGVVEVISSRGSVNRELGSYEWDDNRTWFLWSGAAVGWRDLKSPTSCGPTDFVYDFADTYAVGMSTYQFDSSYPVLHPSATPIDISGFPQYVDFIASAEVATRDAIVQIGFDLSRGSMPNNNDCTNWTVLTNRKEGSRGAWASCDSTDVWLEPSWTTITSAPAAGWIPGHFGSTCFSPGLLP